MLSTGEAGAPSNSCCRHGVVPTARRGVARRGVDGEWHVPPGSTRLHQAPPGSTHLSTGTPPVATRRRALWQRPTDGKNCDAKIVAQLRRDGSINMGYPIGLLDQWRAMLYMSGPKLPEDKATAATAATALGAGHDQDRYPKHHPYRQHPLPQPARQTPMGPLGVEPGWRLTVMIRKTACWRSIMR